MAPVAATPGLPATPGTTVGITGGAAPRRGGGARGGAPGGPPAAAGRGAEVARGGAPVGPLAGVEREGAGDAPAGRSERGGAGGGPPVGWGGFEGRGVAGGLSLLGPGGVPPTPPGRGGCPCGRDA